MIPTGMQVCTLVWDHQIGDENTQGKRYIKATNDSIIRGLCLSCAPGKNAGRALLGHNLTLGYLIGYAQHAATSASTRQNNLKHIRGASTGEESYGYRLC